ncbi:hypothetical protein C8R45DRAFT_879847 [Mycena sanguinolenta]|nr:hypothetical protein C8R45DRAFT_879847 [Mycena sanguinolenta]
MKSFFALVALASLAGIALADNCTPGLDYCGYSLISKGNYQGQIDQALLCAGVSEEDSGHSALFACLGGPSGLVTYRRSCEVGRCIDGGSGLSDHC